MDNVIAEVWKLERLDYDKQEFIPVDELIVLYSESEEWVKKHHQCFGFFKAVIKKWKKDHGMEHETIIVASKYFILEGNNHNQEDCLDFEKCELRAVMGTCNPNCPYHQKPRGTTPPPKPPHQL